MFKLTFRPPYNRDNSEVKVYNDIKDLGDFIYSLTGNITETDSAMSWCNRANFGMKVTRQPNYIIECITDAEASMYAQKEKTGK